MPKGIYIRTPRMKIWKYNRALGMKTGKYTRTPEMKIGKFIRTEEMNREMSEIARRKGFGKWMVGKKCPWNAERLKGLTGEKARAWKGGLSQRKRKNERNDSAYQDWVREVKKRDKWKCRINNEDCFGYREVHHILSWKDFPGLRYNINNGITLCQYHHPKKRIDEERLIPIFQELVESKELI